MKEKLKFGVRYFRKNVCDKCTGTGAGTFSCKENINKCIMVEIWRALKEMD